VRISATEYCEGGYSEQDMITLCQALERAGVIAIDMSGGTNESPQLSRYCIQPPSFARRFLEPYARPIAKALGMNRREVEVISRKTWPRCVPVRAPRSSVCARSPTTDP